MKKDDPDLLNVKHKRDGCISGTKIRRKRKRGKGDEEGGGNGNGDDSVALTLHEIAMGNVIRQDEVRRTERTSEDDLPYEEVIGRIANRNIRSRRIIKTRMVR